MRNPLYGGGAMNRKIADSSVLVRLALCLILFGLSATQLAHGADAARCEALFVQNSNAADDVSGIEGRSGRVAMAEALVEAGLQDSAYAVNWKLKRQSESGPYSRSGEFIAVGIPDKKVAQWVRAVGRNTIGLGLNGFGMYDSLGSAILRVGDKFFSYSTIQDGGIPYPVRTQSFTEATFFVTPYEMKAILDFIKARKLRTIRAVSKIRGGPLEGGVISPEFDDSKNSLTKESCAGACTSFANPLWLEHYQDLPGAAILRQLVDRLELESTATARGMVWRHARLSNVMAVTQLRFTPEVGMSFMDSNKWGNLRGLPIYSLIPDPLSGENNQLVSKRTPLDEWLKSARQ